MERYIPSRIDVTRDGGGDNDERSAFERTIQADKLYVLDRGYAKFTWFNAVHAAGSSYVCLGGMRPHPARDIRTELRSAV